MNVRGKFDGGQHSDHKHTDPSANLITTFPIALYLPFRLAAAEYAKILAQRQKEAKEAKELKRRRLVGLISSPSCRTIL